MVIVPLDVRDERSVRSCIETVLDRTRQIDALVDNAGYALVSALEETSLKEARDLFETNFFGVLAMSKAVLPIFRRQGSGRIVNIGSAVGFIPAPYQALYSASKHAIEGYSESLDHEVRQFGIRVSVVEAGLTRTTIAANLQPATDLLEPYETDRRSVIDAVRKNVAEGDNPRNVALIVAKAITSRSPGQIYLAGWEARLVSLLGKFAPSRLFEKGLRKQFGSASA